MGGRSQALNNQGMAVRNQNIACHGASSKMGILNSESTKQIKISFAFRWTVRFLAALSSSRSLVVGWLVGLSVGLSVGDVCEKVTFRVSKGVSE